MGYSTVIFTGYFNSLGMNDLCRAIFVKLNYFPFFALIADLKYKYYKYYIIYE